MILVIDGSRTLFSTPPLFSFLRIEIKLAQFYIIKGVKGGIAQQFIRDIKKCAQKYKSEYDHLSYMRYPITLFIFTV